MLARLDRRGVADPAADLPRPDVTGDEPLAVVRELIARVRSEGDAALLELTARFDGAQLGRCGYPRPPWKRPGRRRRPVRRALEVAVDSIAAYHRHQLRPASDFVNPSTGVRIATSYSPVRRAGCYVPGGRAAYPSTVIHTAVPAMVAGVEEVVVCVPPAGPGGITPVTLAAAYAAEVSEVYAVGGAQAVAALAYGTQSITAVDVICGPGNRFVALAKREVAGVVGVPSAFAGPSEVVVIADGSVRPSDAAADVILQAEHGPDGLAWLITWDPQVAEQVNAEIARQVEAAPRRRDIEATLASAGHVVLVDDLDAALAVSDHIAPEHLELLVEDAEAVAAPRAQRGRRVLWQVESGIGGGLRGRAIPCAAHPWHRPILLGSDSGRLLRQHHTVTLDADALERLGPHVIALAEAEGLSAHAQSIRGAGRGLVTRPKVRDDVALIPGYQLTAAGCGGAAEHQRGPRGPTGGIRSPPGRTPGRTRLESLPGPGAPTGQPLRARIAEVEGATPDEVFAANGSNEVLQCLALAYGGAGRRALTFEPTYALHSHICRVTGTEVVSVPRADDFTLSADLVGEAIANHRPAITFLCNPNNPTGLAEDPAVRSGVGGVRSAGVAAGRGRGLRTVRPVVGRRAVGRGSAARGHADLLQDLVDGGGEVGLPVGTRLGGGGDGTGRVALPPGRDDPGGGGVGAGLRR